MSILKTSMNKLFQLKYILLMIFPAFVRSGNCDKSQRLITMPRIIRRFLTKLYKLSNRLLITYSNEYVVETRRVELLTSCVQSRRSTN